MTSVITSVIKSISQSLALEHLRFFGDGPGLLSFLFHKLFVDEAEMQDPTVDPLEGVLMTRFREFLEYYLQAGYQFVSPDQVLRGLPDDGRYVLLTFDDSYHDNVRVLGILREYTIPAVFFISSNHIVNNRCFWWDVLYRERRKAGASVSAIRLEQNQMKVRRHDEIERALVAEFGVGALRPQGELDRPFTPAELREFAGHPLVHIGNHTLDHAILTIYGPGDIRHQIEQNQVALQHLTGQTPEIISYPNGNYSPVVLQVTQEIGFRLGLGVQPGKNHLPLAPGTKDALMLNRNILRGDRPWMKQCRLARADWGRIARLRHPSGY